MIHECFFYVKFSRLRALLFYNKIVFQPNLRASSQILRRKVGRGRQKEKKITSIGVTIDGDINDFSMGEATSLPLATGVSLSRPDTHVFVFGGDGDGFSIGGNHLEHCARKNINLTYVIMDNYVYGLTKKQTSPTSRIGYKSKTDPTGAIDRPVNPMRKLISAGATFVARSHASQVKHMMAMYERAILHPGFSVVQTLSECVIFNPGSFDDSIPRKGGVFETIDEKKWDDTPEDAERHDVTNDVSAYQLAEDQYPGKFGVFYEEDRPTKNVLEQKWIDASQEKIGDAKAADLLRKRFAMMK